MKNTKNIVRLIGHLATDPQVHILKSGKKKASFSLLTQDTFQNEKGEKIVDVRSHNMVTRDDLADFVLGRLKKGTEIVVEGRLTHLVYKLDIETRYFTEIKVSELMILRAKA